MSGNPNKMMRLFIYRSIVDEFGYITKKNIIAAFGGLSENTVKKYLRELEPINNKKPRSYKLPHRAKLEMSVLEL